MSALDEASCTHVYEHYACALPSIPLLLLTALRDRAADRAAGGALTTRYSVGMRSVKVHFETR